MTPLTGRFDLLTAPLDEGTVLLEASAGTGKTYTLTGIVVRMLLEGVVDQLDQVLVVTFTIAATDELKHRLRRALRDAIAAIEGGPAATPFLRSLLRHGPNGAQVLRRALDEFDQLGVQTIHGFCKRLLDEAAFESHEPFELEFAIDELPLWQRAAADALRRVLAFDSPALGALLHAAELHPDNLVKLYRVWRRYPNVQLEPDAPQLALQLGNLQALLPGAAAQWDEPSAQRIAHVQWRSGKQPWSDDPTAYLAAITQRLADQPAHCLDLLASMSRRGMDDRIVKKSLLSLDTPFFAACDDVERQHAVALAHLHSHLLLDMHARLELHKQADRVLTFQDLLERAHRAVHDPERRHMLLAALRQRYRVGLIDEFQDTDALQYEIFATVFANRPLFLIGDPKQSIYGFRGADLRTYLAASTHAIARPTLDTNFRSSAGLVQAVSHLFGREDSFAETGFRLPAVQASAAADQLQLSGDDGPPLRWRLLPMPPWPMRNANGWAADAARAVIATDVACEIRRLLDAGVRIDARQLRPGDIAVLTRRNVEATLMQDVLRQHGIHSVIGKAGDVFLTAELHELELILRAVLQPTDLQRARAAMATRIWGLDAAAMSQVDEQDAAFEHELDRLEQWRHTWTRAGFFVMKEQLLQELGTEARLLAQAGGERRLTNLQQLGEMLHQAEHEHRLSPEGLLQWLEHECRQQDEIDYQRRELRLESDADAVQILTMHGSKGLQYEVVFCPFLWDGRSASKTNVVIDVGSERRLALRIPGDDGTGPALDSQQLAEDVRLAYVAITRARRRCYVHWGPIGNKQTGFHRSALLWLLRSPDEPRTGERTLMDIAVKVEAILRAFVDRSPQSMAIDVVDTQACMAPPTARARTGTVATNTRGIRPPQPAPRRAFGLHSFTSMVAHREAEPMLRDVRDPALPAASASHEGSGIFGFARGAEAGVCLHEILEHVPLAQLDDHATTRVRTTLQAHGLLDAAAHPGTVEPERDVMQNLRDLAGALVQPAGPTLAELTRGAHAAEWQFTFPLTPTDLRVLAQHFADHGGPVARAYAPRLSTLPPRTLHGFVNGFADLIAEHDGRYWLLDWKSNHLGNRLDDYGDDALQRSMFEHDYVLQYHVYALALHLHLRSRLPGYDHARHFGGALYVYLRGAKAGTTSGMFCDRPCAALLEAMQRWALGPRGRA